jgi:transposase
VSVKCYQFSVRGLNRSCNHDLKNLFTGAAVLASSKPGPFREFYTALLAKGMRPEMARLTLARKIATIVLIVWKGGLSVLALLSHSGLVP